MNTSKASASKASSNNKVMRGRPRHCGRASIISACLILTACLVSCSAPRQAPPALPASAPGLPSAPPRTQPPPQPHLSRGPAPAAASAAAPGCAAGSVRAGSSCWAPAQWSDLPGWGQDPLAQAWPALVHSCQRPTAAFAPLCPQMRQLTLASAQQQSQWLMDTLQPYRVLDLEGRAQGLLTGYFEPILPARRLPAADHSVPLYRPPAGLAERTPWFSRREIDTLPQAMQALRGREIAWLSDPIDALLLHIQGSGRLELTEADGSSRQVRVAFAGTNGQPYRSVNQWLLEQGVQRIAPWPQATKAWAAQNPQRVPELLWSNPRYVFFREEPIGDPAEGPRGALGVPLSAGRSIAVDPSSIAHGTPVWLVSQGPAVQLARLVAAQDSGAAIVGALRVDYFTGTGAQAGELASRIRQPLQAWVLWPR